MSNHCELNPVVKAATRFTLGNGAPAPALCGCGTFAEAMVVHEASIVPVQTTLADEELALLGCGVTTGLGAALNTAGVTPGSSAAVIGCGGATHAIDPADGDPVEQVRALTAGRGVDFAFEVVGRPELIVQAHDMTRKEGTVTMVGMPPAGTMLSLPAITAIFSGKRLVGSVVGGAQILRDFPRFIRLAESGRLDLGSMVSHRITLDEINVGIDLLRRADGVRTVVM
jgi:S-(hydroxymethyl)glutathione dehydrogenase/alcohol dehydrogenase